MCLAGAVVASCSLKKRWLGGRFESFYCNDTFLTLNSANSVKNIQGNSNEHHWGFMKQIVYITVCPNNYSNEFNYIVCNDGSQTQEKRETSRISRLIRYIGDCILHVDVNVKSLQDSIRPLHLASRYNATNAVTFLLTQKADVNIRDIKGRTPLHYATRRGHDKTSKVMIFVKFSLQCC